MKTPVHNIWIYCNHCHTYFFFLNFSLTLYFQGRATIQRDLQSVHPFLKSQIPGRAGMKRRGWGWRHFIVTEGPGVERWGPEDWTIKWCIPHISGKTYCKTSKDPTTHSERPWINPVFRAVTFCRGRLLHVLNMLPSSCYQSSILLSRHDE